MPDVSLLIAALTVAAALSLVVERVLEVVKHLRDSDNAKIEQDQVAESSQLSVVKARELIAGIKSVLDAYQDANRLDAKKLDALRGLRSPAAALSPLVMAPITDVDTHEDSGFERHDNVTIISAATPSLGKAQTALVLALFAAGFGIVLAELFKLTLLSQFLGRAVPHWADITLTGIVIGGGSQPIHVLLRFLTSRKVTETPEPATVSTAKAAQPLIQKEVPALQPAAPAVAQPADDSFWQPIVYNGGVKPEALEQTHLRAAEPDLIVYHHTAMASSIPFQGVVDEFLVNKGWQTGYHCVIMPDGAIKPFCRWDRYGNHAQGLNRRSLGLAFHGNFHTLANDRYSNSDGRFGIQKPTMAQLESGARVVALWVHLYPSIQLDFESDILPHKTAMPGHTVCPGSNFPHEEFRQKITFYHQMWAQSQAAQQQIALFKQNRYVYAIAGAQS